MITCFIDETGDTGLGERSSKYFTFSALASRKPDEIRQIVTNIPVSKKLAEIKFSNLSHAERVNLLKRLTMTDNFIFFNIYNKKYMDLFFKKSEKFYSEVLKIFFHFIKENLKKERDFTFIVDERTKTKPSKFFFELFQDITKADAMEAIEYTETPYGYSLKMPLKYARVTSLKIEYQNSIHEPGIQAADVIAGCIKELLQRGNDCYLKIIEEKTLMRELPEGYGNKVSILQPYESQIKSLKQGQKGVTFNFPPYK